MGKNNEVKSEKHPVQEYVSPIAKPLFEGKLLERSVKLIRKALEGERQFREMATEGKSKNKVRYVRRGVAEVTKSIRKGDTGIVFFAIDVYPVDIIAHLPVFCEEKGIAYGYLSCKEKLGAACRSKRPTAVIMVCLDDLSADNELKTLYDKVRKGARKINPYL